EMLFRQKDRHPVMHFCDKIIRLGDYHRAGFKRLTGPSIRPFVPEARDRERRRSITRREVPRLLSARRVLPFVVAGDGDKAALTLKCLAEKWLGSDRFRSRVKRGELQFLERLAPPRRHKTPTSTHQLPLAVLSHYRVDRGGGADIEAGLEIMRRYPQRKPVQRDNFVPRQLVCGASAHARNIGP